MGGFTIVTAALHGFRIYLSECEDIHIRTRGLSAVHIRTSVLLSGLGAAGISLVA